MGFFLCVYLYIIIHSLAGSYPKCANSEAGAATGREGCRGEPAGGASVRPGGVEQEARDGGGDWSAGGSATEGRAHAAEGGI